MRHGQALGPDDLIACYYTLARADREGRARIPFPDRVRAAAAAGFAGIGIQPHDHARSVEEGLSERQMFDLLEAEGVALAEVDGVPWWPADGQDEADLEAAQREVLRVASDFGAHHVVAPMPSLAEMPPFEELVRRLAVLGQRAGSDGVKVGFEFLPWTPVSTLETASAVVGEVARPEVGLTVDFWHTTAGGAGPAEVAALPGERVVAVHLTDGHRDPTLDPLAETMVGRRLPGLGEFDVVGLIEALDAAGSTAPIGVEAVSLDHRHLSVDELAHEVVHRTRAAMAAARA
jgi:sugar phosphate isomerase/epimerase